MGERTIKALMGPRVARDDRRALAELKEAALRHAVLLWTLTLLSSIRSLLALYIIAEPYQLHRVS